MTQLPRARGVSRLPPHDEELRQVVKKTSVAVIFDQELTDTELRYLHDMLAGRVWPKLPTGYAIVPIDVPDNILDPMCAKFSDPEGWKKGRRAEWKNILQMCAMMPPVFVNGELPQGEWEGRIHMAIAGQRMSQSALGDLDMLEKQLAYEIQMDGINDDKARAYVSVKEYKRQAAAFHG